MSTKMLSWALAGARRRAMWKRAMRLISRLKKPLSIRAAYVMGSFTTRKKRPADVDFIVLVKIKEGKKRSWPIDLVLAPDNKTGKRVLEDAKKWMEHKYGKKKSFVTKVL